MHFSNIVLAVLPALALASEGSTTTHTATTVLTKTYFLSEVHTVTSAGETPSASAIVTPTPSVVEPVVSSSAPSSSAVAAPSSSTAVFVPAPAPVAPPAVNGTIPAKNATAAITPASIKPTNIPDQSAGSGLEAGKLAFAGVVGMLAVALI